MRSTIFELLVIMRISSRTFIDDFVIKTDLTQKSNKVKNVEANFCVTKNDIN